MTFLIRSLPPEEPKVLIGDNLAAHFSTYVIAKCEEHNVRFMFLPENSTQMLQPLDVAVFSPVKWRWRAILNDWKRECMMAGKDISTLPKKELPPLLAKLLEKDFSSSVISGFEACGLVPFCPQKALMRLPVPPDQRQIDSDVQRQLLEKLETMRYGNREKVRAVRPKKSQKLPAGSSYTCAAGRVGQSLFRSSLFRSFQKERKSAKRANRSFALFFALFSSFPKRAIAQPWLQGIRWLK